MKNTSLVSIVTPMYNAEKYILETIESVIKQTYQNWEMIIVDNFSTDESRELVKSIDDPRIKLIELNVNSGGPARPRNIGIENSTGEYIAFLDADDLWLPQKLQEQISFMQKEAVNFSATQFQEFNENGNIFNIKVSLKNMLAPLQPLSLCNLFNENFLALSSVVVKRNVLKPFNEDSDYIAVEDYGLWIELFIDENVKFKMLYKKLLRYRVLFGSISERAIPFKQDIKAKRIALEYLEKYKLYNLYPCLYMNKYTKIIKSFYRNK